MRKILLLSFVLFVVVSAVAPATEAKTKRPKRVITLTQRAIKMQKDVDQILLIQQETLSTVQKSAIDDKERDEQLAKDVQSLRVLVVENHIEDQKVLEQIRDRQRFELLLSIAALILGLAILIYFAIGLSSVRDSITVYIRDRNNPVNRATENDEQRFQATNQLRNGGWLGFEINPVFGFAHFTPNGQWISLQGDEILVIDREDVQNGNTDNVAHWYGRRQNENELNWEKRYHIESQEQN